MPDDSDWAADMAERERQALIKRARAGLPPPSAPHRGPVFGARADAPAPDRLARVLDKREE
jgi:hypothetical protein